ncbi:MAG: ORF6N domain-containing protein [Bacteroidetes bacterium]|nr:ORF6N domain-containing protein [Bacteroidota bacterium]MCL6100341.1 ORF6N domain-containing protein [Bacteroidota bacterium]
MALKKVSKTQLTLYKRIEGMIFSLRGEKVILDSDLAAIYGVTTARLNQQVKRNAERFPSDFVFRLTKKEFDSLMLQFATSNLSRGGRRKIPFAFTEHGAIMAANVLNSNKAVQMSVLVVRAFVQIRKSIVAYDEFTKRLRELEQKVTNHDNDIQEIVEAIRQLMAPPEKSKRSYGFSVEESKAKYDASKQKAK